MPQLNPTPWFFTLLLSWTTMLMIFKMKILFSTPMTAPTTPNLLTYNMAPWTWPWT